MFNMDAMRAGAEAFGKVAENIEAIRDVAFALAREQGLACPHCADFGISTPIAGHYGEHATSEGAADNATG